MNIAKILPDLFGQSRFAMYVADRSHLAVRSTGTRSESEAVPVHNMEVAFGATTEKCGHDTYTFGQIWFRFLHK